MVWAIYSLVTLWFEEHDWQEITKEIPQKYFLDLTQGVWENIFSIRQLGGGGGVSGGSKKLFALFLRNFLFTLWKKIYRCLFSLRLCRKRISNSRLGGWLPAAGWYFLQFCGGESFTIPENAKYSADFLFWARSSIPPFDSSNTDSFDILLHPRWIGGGWIGGGWIGCGLIVRGGYRLWPSRQGWKELRKNYERTTKELRKPGGLI